MEVDEIERNQLESVYAGAEPESIVGLVDPAQSGMSRYKGIRPQYKQAVAMHVAGMTNEEIAQALNRSSSWVWNVLRHPELQEFLQEFTLELARQAGSDAREVINLHTGEAAMKLVWLMRHAGKEELQGRMAESLLDRGGFPKAQIVGQVAMKLEASETQSIREALAQMSETLDPVEEVESTHEILER